MSYILEALKRSQLARERTQVPRLERLLQRERDPVPQQHWVWLAVSVASAALVVALWKTPLLPPPPVQKAELATHPAVEIIAPLSPPVELPTPMNLPAEKESWGDLIAPPPPKPRPSVPVSPREEVAAPPPAVKTPVPPPVVKPAPALPRPVAPVPVDYPDPNLDPKLELELDADVMPMDETDIEAPTPIPLDLIQEIEAFKQQVKREQGTKPAGVLDP